jgi:hypothetical protein
MNDVRRKEIRRALALIGEGKGILEVALTQEQDEFDNMPEDAQGGEDGQRAEDAVDALERAATCCDDAIPRCANRAGCCWPSPRVAIQSMQFVPAQFRARTAHRRGSYQLKTSRPATQQLHHHFVAH